jgi:L-aspartate oxidase
MDATGVPDVPGRFPTVAASVAAAGLDLARDRIPVSPAAHYFTGGVLTDAWGRTTIPGLSACGEVACTGVHGANRLASNSLLEALVFGRRAALAGDAPCPAVVPTEPLASGPIGGGPPLQELRSLADRFLGVVRNGTDLKAVLPMLADGDLPETRAPALIAGLLAEVALRRQESRGGHFRNDFPETLPEWRRRQAVSQKGWASLPVTG